MYGDADVFQFELVVDMPQTPEKKFRAAPGTGKEGIEVKRRLDNYNVNNPQANLIKHVLQKYVKEELTFLAYILKFEISKLEPSVPDTFHKFDRITRRSMDLIIKWYDDHWKIIQPHLQSVKLMDRDEKVIPFEGANA